VKFAIRLWKAEKLIVECQRTAGCCFRYRQIAKCVLRAARGESGPVPQPLPLPKCLPPMDWEQCTAESLEIASNSLKGKCIDGHLVAVQSLAQLTECCMCRPFAAASILSPSSDLLVVLLSLIQGKSNEMLTDTEQEHCNCMRFYAIQVLANCLKLVGTGTVQALPELTSEATVFALVKDVSNASSKPHTAAAACRCLQALVKTESARKLVIELGAANFTAAAQQCRHAILEEESAKLLQEL